MSENSETKWTPLQRIIEKVFQRAMDKRDASPGWLPDRIENSYARNYRHCFRKGDPASVAEFNTLTGDYLNELRKSAREELGLRPIVGRPASRSARGAR